MGFAEEFRAPGQPVIQPQRFAEALHLRVQDLAKLVGNRCLAGVLISGEGRAGRSAADYRRSVVSTDAA
jgi:hypothetical protein